MAGSRKGWHHGLGSKTGSSRRCGDNREMDTKELTEAIARLADLDPAEAPDPADEIAEMLASQLEASEDPDGSAAG